MERLDQGRARLIYGIFALIFAAILVKAWRLQVTQAQDNLDRAGWSIETTQTLAGARGALRDREGLPLAESVQAYTLSFDARTFFRDSRGDEEALIAILAPFPLFDPDAFMALAQLPLEDVPRYQIIARAISPASADQVMRAMAELGVLAVRKEPVFHRFYPMDGIAGSLLGFVDRDGTAGRAGLESALNAQLEGGTLTYKVARDVRRDPYLLGALPDLRGVQGTDVHLTIDLRLQRFAEEALQRAVDKYRAKEAMAIVTNVRTGEILALASVPTFNPNSPFQHPEELIWAPHTISHAHEPGSTAKALTFAAALNEGAITYDTLLDCENGEIRIGNRRIRDTHPEGIIPAWKALQVSSNVCAWKMGLALTAEKHRDYLLRFGLGAAPNVPISGATIGIVPRLRWIDIQHANISFGHGFSASLLQMHMALSTLANEGRRMAPAIVHSFVHGDGRVERVTPEVEEVVVRPDVAAKVMQALESIVYEEGGTGGRAAIPGVRTAGKTGTARLVDPIKGGYIMEYLGSFTGFFPADAPVYAITVWIVHPDKTIGYYGGETAAPVFKEIGQEVVRLYGPPESTWAGSVAAASEALPSRALAPVESNELAMLERVDGALITPNVVGMRARFAIDSLTGDGLDVHAYGTGIVVGQTPEPGTILAPGAIVTLQLAAKEEH